MVGQGVWVLDWTKVDVNFSEKHRLQRKTLLDSFIPLNSNMSFIVRFESPCLIKKRSAVLDLVSHYFIAFLLLVQDQKKEISPLGSCYRQTFGCKIKLMVQGSKYVSPKVTRFRDPPRPAGTPWYNLVAP